ncbi:MAG: dicarboxylate/amino acid:cation symporter [Candidatus Riflebacteria bacterium]
MKDFFRRQGLTFYITLATALGILVGWLVGESAGILEPFGDLFMNLIKMVIVPLVFLSITLGAASLDDVKKAGKIGLHAFSFYMVTTVLAIVIAILLGVAFQPGVGLDRDKLTKVTQTHSISDSNNTEQPLKALSGGFSEKFKAVINAVLFIIPQNPIDAMSRTNMLQIIFFAIFLGLCLASLEKEKKTPVTAVLDGLNLAFIKMINIIMWTAPLGVFALMAVTVGVYGFTTVYMLLKLLLVFILSCLIQFFLVYCGVLKVFTGLSPLKFMQGMERALLVSFTTSSSLVTLPTSMETAEEEFDVNPQISSFVLPLGATVNMDGSAINFGMYAIFGLQFYGIELTAGTVMAIILTATIGSIGAAGVPGPSVLTISVLVAAGVPLEILPLYIATDRIFDMIRTSVNISGDITCAILVNHLNRGANAPIQPEHHERKFI